MSDMTEAPAFPSEALFGGRNYRLLADIHSAYRWRSAPPA